jgi:hypothetical protein
VVVGFGVVVVLAVTLVVVVGLHIGLFDPGLQQAGSFELGSHGGK